MYRSEFETFSLMNTIFTANVNLQALNNMNILMTDMSCMGCTHSRRKITPLH